MSLFSHTQKAGFLITLQSKTQMQFINMDQKPLETKFSIEICYQLFDQFMFVNL